MIEVLIEFILALAQILAELVLQVVFELLAELGVHCTRDWWQPRKPVPRMWAIPGHIVLGALGGFITLLIVPGAMIHSPVWRIINLVITPLLAAGLMTLFGAWRMRRGRDRIRLDHFGYAYLFALSMCLVRFWRTS